MAELNTDGGGGGGKHQKKRAKKQSTKIDMTPMVDLAFLLLTFFVLTATFNKPKVMEIVMPKVDPGTERMEVDDDLAHTVLLGEEETSILYYARKLDTAAGQNLVKTDFSDQGLRKIMMDKNQVAIKKIEELNEKLRRKELKPEDTAYKKQIARAKGHEKAPFVIIKTLPKTKYKSVIDAIDELSIAQIGKYTIVEMSKKEKEFMDLRFPPKNK